MNTSENITSTSNQRANIHINTNNPVDVTSDVTSDNNQMDSLMDGFDNIINDSINALFEPVVIAPSEHQVQTATRCVRYGDIIRPVNTICPITLSEFNETSHVIMILHCGHIFTEPDLRRWFCNNVRCPMCRYDIRNYSTPRFSFRYTSSNTTERPVENEINNIVPSAHPTVSYDEDVDNEDVDDDDVDNDDVDNEDVDDDDVDNEDVDDDDVDDDEDDVDDDNYDEESESENENDELLLNDLYNDIISRK